MIPPEVYLIAKFLYDAETKTTTAFDSVEQSVRSRFISRAWELLEMLDTEGYEIVPAQDPTPPQPGGSE